MNPIVFALRHPYTVLVGVLAVALGVLVDEATTVGYVGMFPTNYPIQAVHQWTTASPVVRAMSCRSG